MVTLPQLHEELGPYRLEAQIGEGGFGAVYRARHIHLDTSVAIKVLKPELVQSSEARARFLREARAIGACKHPGIVHVLDAGEGNGQVWMAMELLTGEELTEQIYRSAPLGPEAGFDYGAQIAEAVAAAHAHGVIHRDLKPDNVFVQQTEKGKLLKILDFGVAKVVRPDDGLSLMTKTGQAIGTPMYMAPEQFLDSSRVDERTDVYSVGAVLYELFARRTPFDAPTVPQIVVQVMREGPPPLTRMRPDLPKHVCDLVHKAMAIDPAARFASAGELTAALRSPHQTAPTRSQVAFDRTMAAPDPAASVVDAFAETAAGNFPEHREAIMEAAVRVSRALVDAPPDVRTQLRAQVAEVEGARADPADDRLWTPLAEGRWTLVDRFDMHGRRYYVAVDNDRASREMRALSDRERQVAQLAAKGLANKEIGFELGLSDSSVATYLTRALEKLRLQDRLELPLVFEESARTITLGGSRLLVSRHAFVRRPELTDSEQEVCEMAARGLSDKAIASVRSCSPRTVANLLRSAYQKLGIANRSELVNALIPAA